MSKRRASLSTEHDRDCGCTCAAKRRALPQPKQRHLYVALDDRDKAYSVYKLDVDGADEQRRLPEPPVLRLEVTKRGDSCLFAALGTKIIAMSTDRSPTLVHDTRTSGLAIGHRPPRALSGSSYLTVAAAGRLYALPPRFTEDMYYLEEEAPPPEEVTSPDSINDDEDEMTRHMNYQRTSSLLDDLRVDKWMWNTVDSRSPVPFEPGAVTCHAVHPDGHTIFVSVQRRRDTWADSGTFSLDASRHGAGDGAGEWTRHGDWVLPFKGQAFFEGQLDAWVGLNEHGHICSCDGVSRSESRRAAPTKKVGKETLLREARQDRRLDAALAHMGHGRFCLVERAAREGSKARHGNGEECVLHVTTFAVRYDKQGDLTVADRRHAGSYAVSTNDRLFKLQAFRHSSCNCFLTCGLIK